MTDEKMDATSDYLEKREKGEIPETPESELPFDKDGNPNHPSVKKSWDEKTLTDLDNEIIQ